ncbi:MAG TPA: ADOP family duplicated permease [Terriglobales bacterium]|nr:ADOP family duplicated permease [Terriglobales bacterium]
MNFAWRAYQMLVRAFPHEFKLAYGTEVAQLGEDMVEEIAKRRGAAGLVRLFADIAIRVPLEYLSEMRRDMRFALRELMKSPGFALVGIVSIGLGIGLTVNVYRSELQLVFRQLPAAAQAKELVTPKDPISYYYVEQYREQRNLVSGVAALQDDVPFNITFPNDTNARPERVFGQLVSPDYFSVLGIQAQRGRVLSAGLDKPGETPVVVISDRFWRNRLNRSPDAVGEMLRLNGQSATIVGITPKNFDGAVSENPAEVFVPITVPAALAPELANDLLHQPNAKEFLAIMRLAPSVTIDAAEAGLDAITRQLDKQNHSAPLLSDQGRRVTLLPANTTLPIPRNLKPVILGFFALLMALVITIVCMNLANMLLARSTARRKEFAIRLAVGASRFRLIRQMLSEGLLLSLLGGVAGFGLAYWLSALNSQFNPNMKVPAGPDLTLDWRADILAFVLALVCGIGFSLVPALRATKADLTPALKQGGLLPLPGYRRFGLRNLLMVAQVAGSLMLLLITGFLVIGISKVSSVQTEFDPKTMYLFSIDPVRDGYPPEKAEALFEKLPGLLKTAGPVRGIALATQLPFSTDDGTTHLTAEESSRVQMSVAKEIVGASYFATLSEPLLAGREFQEQDESSQDDRLKTALLPVVLSESAARQFFGNGNAIGRRVRDDKQSYEVVGVVRDLRNGIGVRQSVIYVPLTRSDFARAPAGGMTIMVRSNAGADALSGIRSEIASIDPQLNLFNVQTLSEYLEYSRSDLRLAVRTYGGIGAFGLVLAAIGLAGVTAYAVAQRRKEIGIRTALGASKAQVLRLALREGAAVVSAGTILGFLGAIAMAKMLSAMTEILVEGLRVGTNDPRLLAGAPLLLGALAMLACYVPARRAAEIDPLQALRQE